jgi:hypothetical protein
MTSEQGRILLCYDEDETRRMYYQNPKPEPASCFITWLLVGDWEEE